MFKGKKTIQYLKRENIVLRENCFLNCKHLQIERIQH